MQKLPERNSRSFAPRDSHFSSQQRKLIRLTLYLENVCNFSKRVFNFFRPVLQPSCSLLLNFKGRRRESIVTILNASLQPIDPSYWVEYKNVIVWSRVFRWQLESPFERGNFSKTFASLDNASCRGCKKLNFLPNKGLSLWNFWIDGCPLEYRRVLFRPSRYVFWTLNCYY